MSHGFPFIRWVELGLKALLAGRQRENEGLLGVSTIDPKYGACNMRMRNVDVKTDKLGQWPVRDREILVCPLCSL